MKEERKKIGARIITLANTKHNDMDDDATDEQRKEIQNYLLAFLNE